MRSEESRIAEAIAVLTARLDAWRVDDAATKASEYVRDMVRNGWRPRALPAGPPLEHPSLRAVPDDVPAYREARLALVPSKPDRAPYLPDHAKPEPEETSDGDV